MSVPGVLEAFQLDPRVIQPASDAFCARLHAAPHEMYGTTDFSPTGHGDFFLRVQSDWSKVRRPGDALLTAHAEAMAHPVALRGRAAFLDDDGPSPKYTFRIVVSIAYHLQRFVGDDLIRLPNPKLAAALPRDQKTVKAAIDTAEKLGLIELVDAEYVAPARRQRASEGSPVKKARARGWRFNFNSELYEPPPGFVAVPEGRCIHCDEIVSHQGARGWECARGHGCRDTEEE